MSLTLTAQIVDQDARAIKVTFATDEVAANYVLDNQHRFWFSIGEEVDLQPWPQVSEALWPTCEHGLSADLCAGPGHYPADNPWDDFS